MSGVSAFSAQPTSQRARRVAVALAALVILAAQALLLDASASTGSSKGTLHRRGTFTVRSQGAGKVVTNSTEYIPNHEPFSPRRQHTAAAGTPRVGAAAISSSQLPGFGGWTGLTHFDQRFAGTGQYANTQFSLEPPDQGLCVGEGDVLEAVNDALQIRDSAGNALTPPIAMTQFYNLPPEIIRSDPPVRNSFPTDPTCYYDPDTRRWFVNMANLPLEPDGAFRNTATLNLAVSQTPDPLGTWTLYEIDVTNDGTNGTPSNPGCPCFGDQPYIGADANGFYISTNEYTFSSFTGPTQYNGAMLYAMSKHGVEDGSNTAFTFINVGPAIPPDGASFAVHPQNAPAGHYETANNGTMYFLSSLDLTAAPSLGIRSDAVAVWALTNTASLDTGSPDLTLSEHIVDTPLYAQPPNAVQKDGPRPLGEADHDPVPLISSNEDRQEEVTFADGKLWSTISTAAKLPNGATQVGALWMIITPSVQNGTLTATLTKAGYVGLDRANVLFPAIGVTDDGNGVMTFSVVSPSAYPQVAYAPLDATNGLGAVRIAANGVEPADGFTGYKTEGFGPAERWGDYSWAVADTSGSVWFATEYTAGGPRSLLANWSTFVGHVTP